MACSSKAPAASTPQRAATLFYQPLHQDNNLNAAQWQQLLQQAAAAGYSELVLQWTEHDDSNFVSNKALLQPVLQAAAANNLGVWLGLTAQSDYFQQMQQPKSVRRQYFRRQLLLSQLQLQRIEQAGLTASAGFAGFYLPLELNDSDFQSMDDVLWLKAELSLFRHSVRAPLAISLYSNASLAVPDYLQAITRLQETGLQLWWQDGAGAGLISSAYRQAILAQLPCQVGVIAEHFRKEAAGLRPATASEISLASAAIRPCHHRLVFSLRYQPFSQGLLSLTPLQ